MTQFTIARLKSLGPGQRLVYYRGNLEYDIEHGWGTPTYRDNLLRLRDTAENLAKLGEIRLEKHACDESKYRLFEYVAIGI